MSMLSQRKRAGKGDRGVKKEGHMKEKESQEGGGKMNVTGERGEGQNKTHRISLIRIEQLLEEPENSEEKRKEASCWFEIYLVL